MEVVGSLHLITNQKAQMVALDGALETINYIINRLAFLRPER
jgi:hypothetical protein